jgi:AcrR family transcriptional regulator
MLVADRPGRVRVSNVIQGPAPTRHQRIARPASAGSAGARTTRNNDKSGTRNGSKNSSWTQDPDGVRRNILDAARVEFTEKGLSGARIDQIAARIETSKRMIFYYFKDKQGLYIAVLEEAYARIRAIEQSLDLASLPPVEALRTLVGFTFDYHANNPDFVRLVMVENIHHARHLKGSAKIAALNHSAITVIEQVYRRGVTEGVFRPDVAPIDIHLTISALCFYNVANRASILQVFGHDMADETIRNSRRGEVIDTALRYVKA